MALGRPIRQHWFRRVWLFFSTVYACGSAEGRDPARPCKGRTIRHRQPNSARPGGSLRVCGLSEEFARRIFRPRKGVGQAAARPGNRLRSRNEIVSSRTCRRRSRLLRRTVMAGFPSDIGIRPTLHRSDRLCGAMFQCHRGTCLHAVSRRRKRRTHHSQTSARESRYNGRSATILQLSENCGCPGFRQGVPNSY